MDLECIKTCRIREDQVELYTKGKVYASRQIGKIIQVRDNNKAWQSWDPIDQPFKQFFKPKEAGDNE